MEKPYNSENIKKPNLTRTIMAALSLGAMAQSLPATEAHAQRLSIPAIESVQGEERLKQVRGLIGTVLESLDAELSGLEPEEVNERIDAEIGDVILQLVMSYVDAMDPSFLNNTPDKSDTFDETFNHIWSAKRDFDEHFSGSGPATSHMREVFETYANSFPKQIG